MNRLAQSAFSLSHVLTFWGAWNFSRAQLPGNDAGWPEYAMALGPMLVGALIEGARVWYTKVPTSSGTLDTEAQLIQAAQEIAAIRKRVAR